MNNALLMKGLWNFFNSQGQPWVELLRRKHYKRRHPALASIPPPGSCQIWRGIFMLISPFLASVNFSLGNGDLTPFWHARWCGDFSLRARLPNLYAASTDTSITVRIWHRQNSQSNYWGFTHSNSSDFPSELSQLADIIHSVDLSVSSPDLLVWRWENNGFFSVKSAYNFLMFDGVRTQLTPCLWKLKLPLRIKLFMWLAARNKVLTADNLTKRGWCGPSICVLCKAQAESLDHLLLACPFAIAMWIQLNHFTGFDVSPLTYPSDGVAVCWMRWRRAVTGDIKRSFDVCFVAGCWELWKERNTRIFDNRGVHSDQVASRALLNINQWISVLGS